MTWRRKGKHITFDHLEERGEGRQRLTVYPIKGQREPCHHHSGFCQKCLQGNTEETSEMGFPECIATHPGLNWIHSGEKMSVVTDLPTLPPNWKDGVGISLTNLKSAKWYKHCIRIDLIITNKTNYISMALINNHSLFRADFPNTRKVKKNSYLI